MVAVHQSGHAVVASLTPSADPVCKVTIVPHGQALGVTAQLPAEEHANDSRSNLLARLDVLLGGRESEALIIGDMTTGAEHDLVQATHLVRRMITRWGWEAWVPWRFRLTKSSRFSATSCPRDATTVIHGRPDRSRGRAPDR